MRHRNLPEARQCESGALAMFITCEACGAVTAVCVPGVPDVDIREEHARWHARSLARVLAECARYKRERDDAREVIAAEIEAEAATHLHSIRRAMRWAAWIARGKPPESDPGNDRDLSRALLHGDAERTSWPCCPVETAAVARALEAERERIRAAAGGLAVTLTRPGNGPAHGQAIDVVPLPVLLRLLGPEPASGQAETGTREPREAGADEKTGEAPGTVQALTAPQGG